MNEASMHSIDIQVNRFRLMDNHASGCNSLKPQPKQEGIQYDVYIVMHCDCFIALKNPTQEEKIKFVRHMATRFAGVHARDCNSSNPIQEKYRDKVVWVTRNCTCWLSQVDKPKESVYTEPMTSEFYIFPLDKEPSVFDRNRTYPSKQAAIDMLAYQGYGVLPQDPDYWGNTLQIVTKGALPDPDLSKIKAEIHKIRANALGPHLDTPIYDQLAREYDKRYNTMDYFETALAQKLKRMGQYNR